ncbi:MAG: HAMP domain-containing histidine kinase [Rhodospirillales bacterium]|nr:HAMP domain-containing histidine kinase [Rhodospirillales bacterium]
MAETSPHRPGFLRSLSFRLLLLTIFFVMLAEFLIWAPSVARYRKVYLEENIVRGHLSMIALETMPEEPVAKALEQALLFHTNAYSIVLDRPERRSLMVSKEMPPKVDLVVDLRQGSFFGFIEDAFVALAQTRNRVIRVIGISPKDPKVTVEALLDEAPMRAAMWDYSGRIFNLSIMISLFTAGLVYLSLQLLLVVPMRRITEGMARFRRAPEDSTRMITASARIDEVGIAERELAVMQKELRAALQQKTRLAALGAAVAKINHDLRNSLATAVLASDKLADIDDPEVKRVVPRLFKSIDRAVTLCSQTLNFVSDADVHLVLSRFPLKELVEEAGTTVKVIDDKGRGLEWRNEVAEGIALEADRGQLFRVLSNLGRNALEAGAGAVRVGARRDGHWIVIEVADDGPGLAPAARAKLFQPFAGSAKDGGTGLGLAIVRDIARAHGGDVALVEAEGQGKGATFRLTLPADRGDVT